MSDVDHYEIAQRQAADAWQRLDWANSDGFALGAWMKRMAEHEPWTFAVRPSESGPWLVCLQRVVPPDEEARLLLGVSRLFGSFLDHSRAALNYLAVGLVHLDISMGARDLDPKKGDFGN